MTHVSTEFQVTIRPSISAKRSEQSSIAFPMAPPLALVAKDVLPVDCMALIKEYATDKRAAHPVALLVKRFRGRFVLHRLLLRPTNIQGAVLSPAGLSVCTVFSQELSAEG